MSFSGWVVLNLTHGEFFNVGATNVDITAFLKMSK
ncbi:hypothetical protein [Brochothrix phage ADU4]|nr:hypothetical protein [Brochothrix phage ADU4]